jgi:hypothetical protein
MSGKTENRRPHTVYLRDELWDALDRRYLETRLSSPTPPSKIEFIEKVLKAGMETLAAAAADVSSAEKNRKKPPQPAQAMLEKTTTSENRTDMSTTSDSTQSDEQETAEKTSPATSPTRQASRRSSALRRLMQASEPGRPAPINSAATTEYQETEEHQ